MNSDDHSTRGLAPCDLQKLWITAPSFLIKPESEWTFSGDKIAQTYATQVDVKTSEKPLVDPNRFSNWPRLLGAIRTEFRAVRVLKRLIKRDVPCDLDDFAADENKAPCTPFLDSDGLLRVEGRIQKSGLSFQSKHPVILHSKCRVAKLLIEKAHHDCGHHGIEHVRAHIQATFMIVGIRRALRTLGKYCFICRRWRADNVRPNMAPLPKFRFPELSKLYPFVNTGMDMFGPFHIEKSRTQTELNYVCMFTCLVTRAVHLEVCEDLSTDCLLMAIRRFVSRRGYPDVIVSDNGKNFVGANQAMKLNFQENYKPDINYIRLQLAQQNIQWTFNPPLALHFGGVWERLIQSAKRSLLAVLGSRRLNFSVFHTVVAEAEGILNSRRLTHVGSTLTDEEPLTPNHFLMRRRHFCLKPLGNNRTRFSIKDFKESQTLLDHYWSRLLKEFVPELNRRTKWQQANAELKEDDVVWLYKDFTPRGIWPIGRIVKAHVSRDGVARSFDIKTSTGMVLRPAVRLGKVFETDNDSSSSLAAEDE